MKNIGIVVFVPRASARFLHAGKVLKAGGFTSGSSVLFWANDTPASREALREVARRSLAADVPVGVGVLPVVETDNVDAILDAAGARGLVAAATAEGVAAWQACNPIQDDYLEMLETLARCPRPVQQLILRTVADRQTPETVPAGLRRMVIANCQTYLEQTAGEKLARMEETC